MALPQALGRQSPFLVAKPVPPLLTCQGPNSEACVPFALTEDIQHLQNNKRRVLLSPPLLQESRILSALVRRHQVLDSEFTWQVKEDTKNKQKRIRMTAGAKMSLAHSVIVVKVVISLTGELLWLVFSFLF